MRKGSPTRRAFCLDAAVLDDRNHSVRAGADDHEVTAPRNEVEVAPELGVGTVDLPRDRTQVIVAVRDRYTDVDAESRSRKAIEAEPEALVKLVPVAG